MNKKILIIFLCLIAVFTSGCVQSKQNVAYKSTENIPKEEKIANNSQVANQSNTIQPLSFSAVQKTDYLGHWEDIAAIAVIDITNFDDYIEIEVNRSRSAIDNTKYIFECQYNSVNNNLICKNGKEIDSYPTVNGIRVNTYPEDDNYIIEKKTIKQNLQATVSIKKGNLRSALDERDYMWDKNKAMKIYQNMTLKIKVDNPILSDCIFVKDL